MKKHQLKKQISLKELQIKSMRDVDIHNKLYNSLILEKAVLKKELEFLEKNFFVEKIKNVFPRKEKLICDYFKS